MDFILVSFGTNGDINPYVALGEALKNRGYGVKIMTNELFRNLVESRGLQFVQVGTAREFREIVGHKSFFHPVKSFNFVVRHLIIRYMRGFYEAILREATSGTVIISQSFAPATRIVHEKYQIPYITVNLQPFSFWSYAHPPVYPGLNFLERLSPSLKRSMLQFVNKRYIDKKFASGLNPFLKELGLKSQDNFFFNWLYSPQLVIGAFPEWYARPATDWPVNTRLTGFIALEEAGELPVKVAEFLRNGKPPLVFTFGSSMQNASRFFKEAIVAVNRLKRRAIFITANPAEISDSISGDILVSGYIPFRMVFPHIEAIIHHAGIGTISHAMAAGKPQLMVPFAHDQPDNASRAEKLGSGLVLFPEKYSVGALVEKLEQLSSSQVIKDNCLQYAGMVDFKKSMDKMINLVEDFAFATSSHKQSSLNF